jgi:CubicO group peptidase (beta-lactamase class C family)
MMAREIIEFTRLALRRCVELEELLDWRSLLPDFPAPPTLPPWLPPAPAVDADWVRDYFRGLAATLDRAGGSVAETPAVVEAFERASRAVRTPRAA